MNKTMLIGLTMDTLALCGTMAFGDEAGWTKGPNFSFDTRAEKTILGLSAEQITYSGDGWGEGGSGVTVGCSFEGGATNVLVALTTENGVCEWTPTANGRYRLVHAVEGDETVEAVVVVNGLPGGEGNPWEIGDGDAESVTAYLKDGVLYIGGSGAMTDFADAADVPWVGTKFTAVSVGAEVTKIGANAWAGMDDTVKVNAMEISELRLLSGGFAGGESPAGAISPAEFDRIEIVDGKAYLGVEVWTNGTLTTEKEGWGVATNGFIEVPASAPSGYYILNSKGGAASNAAELRLIQEGRIERVVPQEE